MKYITPIRLTALVVAALACGCDEGPGIAGDSAATDLPPVQKSRRDEARTRVVVREGVDDSVWTAHTGAPAVALTAPPTTPIEPIDTWTPPAGAHADADLAVRRFADGEVCTFGSQDWGALCFDDTTDAACLRDQHWARAMPGGIEVGRTHKLVLTSAAAVADALPAGGRVGPLRASQYDPLPMNANPLAAEVAALELNLAFAQLGYLGSYDLGAVRVAGGVFGGWTFAEVADISARIVGGEAYLAEAVGLPGYHALLDELQALNLAGEDCQAAHYIRP